MVPEIIPQIATDTMSQMQPMVLEYLPTKLGDFRGKC